MLDITGQAIDFQNIAGYHPFLDKTSKNIKLANSLVNSYKFYFEMLSLIAQNAWEWKNIPIEIPSYQIEKCLFWTGMAGMTYDDIKEEYIILPVVYNSGGLNIYGEPNSYKLFSYSNSYNINIKNNNKEGAVCFNNNNKKGNVYLAYRYARRLQLIDDIIDMNIDNQKCPLIVIARDEKEKLSLKNLVEKIKLGERAIYVYKDLTQEDIKTLDLKVELKSEELLNAKREIYNEACLYLGITSNLQNKKERLIASEVENENQRYGIYRKIGLSTRKYFCKKINKLYKLDIDVNFSTDIMSDEMIEENIIDTNKDNREEKLDTIKKKMEG